MAGPWEKYATPDAPASGPWSGYAEAPAKTGRGGAEGGWDDKPPTRMQRIGRGLVDPIEGGAQLLTKMLSTDVVKAGDRLNNWLADKTGLVSRLPEGGVDQQIRSSEQAYQAARGADAGFDGYRTIGNVLSPANLALAAGAPAALTLPGRMAVGSGIGLTSAALNPVNSENYWGEKRKQLGAGTVLGAATPVISSAIGRMISPNASTNPNLELLRREGVNPTVGQSLGGWANVVEEKATSLPIMGDMISRARTQAQREFNQAAINRATAPINARVQGTGQDAVREAGDLIGDAYTAARNQMGAFQIDQQGTAEIARIRNIVSQLPRQQQRTFQNTFDAISTDISPNGTIPAQVFKRIDSKIGKDAANFSGSTDSYQRQLGEALTELQNSIAAAGRRANPNADAMFTAADRAYANLVRLEGASKAAINSEGVFTPGQLNAAIRQADQSVRKRAVGRGTALMQDLGNAGQQVLGNKVPNSGTADRLMLGGAGVGAGLVNPAIPLGLLGGAAMYTAPMQALLRGAVSARPQMAQPVRDAFMQISPGLLPLSTQVGLGLLE